MRFMLPALYQSWCVEGGIHIIFLVDTKNKTKTKDKSFSFFLSTLSSVGHSSLPMQHSSCIPKQMTACVRPLSCLLRVTFF